MAATEYSAPVDEKEGLAEYARFMGLRNNVEPEAFGMDDLAVALNVDINDALRIRRRKGASPVVLAGVDRDLWASGATCLAVGSNALKQIFPDYSTLTLRTGLAPARPLSYAEVGARVYYANGAELGCVENGANRSWGLTPPPPIPAATATAGALAPGIYQYAMTYLRNDGQESGAVGSGVIELEVMGGISLNNLAVSSDPTVAQKIIYLSPVGGQVVYQTGIIANSATAFVVDEIRANTTRLITQFFAPPPAGDFIAYWRGHMLVATNNRLYPSEPYSPELFDLRKSIPFSDVITMIAPIDDGKVFRQHGIFIGTDSQLIWMEGETPEKWHYRVIANYGVIPGSLFYGDGELLGAGDSKEKIAFFASKTGLCAGKMGGEFINLTQHRFAYPVMDRGAGVVRRHEGMAQYLVTLQGAQVPGNAVS